MAKHVSHVTLYGTSIVILVTRKDINIAGSDTIWAIPTLNYYNITGPTRQSCYSVWLVDSHTWTTRKTMMAKTKYCRHYQTYKATLSLSNHSVASCYMSTVLLARTSILATTGCPSVVEIWSSKYDIAGSDTIWAIPTLNNYSVNGETRQPCYSEWHVNSHTCYSQGHQL